MVAGRPLLKPVTLTALTPDVFLPIHNACMYQQMHPNLSNRKDTIVRLRRNGTLNPAHIALWVIDYITPLSVILLCLWDR